MIQCVYKPKRFKNGKRVESRLYWGKYALLPHEKPTYVALKTTDKRIAEDRLAKIVREVEMERAGLAVPKTLKAAAQKPLANHLADWVADLRARRCNRGYIKVVNQRVTSLIDACGWTFPRDVTTDTFITWRSGQSGKSAKTLNEYLAAISRLMNWMVETDRLLANPLKCKRIDARGKEVAARRAFTIAEVRQILAVSKRRRPVYLTAAQTGLRRGEITKLVWGDVHLEASPPYIHVRRQITKNKKDRWVPLKPEVVRELQSLRSDGVADGVRVFKGMVPTRQTVIDDLKAAGIPRYDSAGRKVDFHAFRHTFVTRANRGKSGGRVTMEVAGHSRRDLTDRIYTDVSQLPLADVLDVLPDYLEQGSQIDSPKRDAAGPTVARPDTNQIAVSDETAFSTWQGVSRLVPAMQGIGGGGNRTRVP